MDEQGRPGVTEIARWAGRSQRLRQRRFELLALRGPGAVFTHAQGRSPSASSMAPAGLAELISSIAEVGVLQPVLVEETHSPGQPPQFRLITGERRLRAVQWGAHNLPTNPHFERLPAVVCPGPLNNDEIRIWQLIENLAREDLQPGELAAALLFERCDLLAQRLHAAGVHVDEAVWALDDPIGRWDALDGLRPTRGSAIGAPWPEVLRRIGIQMTEEKAKRLVRALRALPPEISEDMDAHAVALATRHSYLGMLNQGRSQAAADIWAAVRTLGQPRLLGAAVREATADPELATSDAVARAQDLHTAANEARRLANQPPGGHELVDVDDAEADGPLDVSALLGTQRSVIAELRAGRQPNRFDAGSLQLGARQLLELLAATAGEASLHPPVSEEPGEAA